MEDTALAPFPDRLERALRRPIPGLAAQQRMAPQHRRFEPEPGTAVRESAVVALFYAHNGSPDLVLTLRSDSLRHHKGEVCFPGGGREDSDHTLRDTALRELEEELGLPRAQVRILGSLTPLYIEPSRNRVHPFVGWIPHFPTFSIDRVEVARVLAVPLSCLLDPSTQSSYEWERNEQQLTAPCYRVDSVCIWGATAMMLSELLQVIAEL